MLFILYLKFSTPPERTGRFEHIPPLSWRASQPSRPQHRLEEIVSKTRETVQYRTAGLRADTDERAAGCEVCRTVGVEFDVWCAYCFDEDVEFRLRGMVFQLLV